MTFELGNCFSCDDDVSSVHGYSVTSDLWNELEIHSWVMIFTALGCRLSCLSTSIHIQSHAQVLLL